MTLIGRDHSVVRRAWTGMRAALSPRAPSPIRHDPPVLIGHRGAKHAFPENTIAGCRRAVELGAGGIEIDVCVSSDGHVVLWHDGDSGSLLSRARRRGADGTPFVPVVPHDRRKLPISEQTLAEIEAGYGYARHGAPLTGHEPELVHGVDRFDDLVSWAAGEPRCQVLMVDAKLKLNELAFVRPLISSLARAVWEHPELASRRLHLLSCEREVYEALRRELDRAKLEHWCLTADFELPGVLKTARELGATHIALGVTLRRLWSAVRNDVVETVRARRRGLLESVSVWTIDNRDHLDELCEIGVDNVIVSDELLPQAAQSAVTST